MSFAANGVYTPPSGATTASPGAVIRSATWNTIFTDISSALTLLGQVLYNDTTVLIGASPYTPVATDTTLLLTTSGGAITISLPSAASRNGYPLTIKDATGNAATNNITINRNGSDTIEGLTSIVIGNNYGEIDLFPVTGGWLIDSTNVQNASSTTLNVTGTSTFTGPVIGKSTTAPSSAAGNTVIVGTLANTTTAPLSQNGIGYLYNTAVNGAILEGQGSTSDVAICHHNGGIALQVPTNTVNVQFNGSALSLSASGGVGYSTGAGNSVTQATSRTTAVTSNTITGQITMFSAAGSAAAATFTVNCNIIGPDDTVILTQKSGTNLYEFFCTAISQFTSFNITFFTTGGTATDAPVINYAIIKGSHN